MSEVSFRVVPVRSAADLKATVVLFEAALPDKYAPPSGELLLARDNHDHPSGCVGLRPLPAHGCCEMKRLYVLPQARGLGLGRALIDAIIGEAKRIGYQAICLDTLPTMVDALSLYKQAGFRPIDPYYDTPIAGTSFLGRSLVT